MYLKLTSVDELTEGDWIVKNGIPFVPSFLISVIISLVFGWFLIVF